ncbi:MAG: GtrA family protein [Eubacterium sp.]|jgi:putative flippase GtrA
MTMKRWFQIHLHGLIDETTVRFIITGLINTLVGCGTMFLLYNALGCGYWFSTAMNYIVGSVCSYFLNKYYTFRCRGYSGMELVRFIVNIALCYFVAYGMAIPAAQVLLGTGSGSAHGNLAMMIGMVLFVGMNYLGQKYFVFRRRSYAQQ